MGLLTPTKSYVLDDRNSRKNTDVSKEVESLEEEKKLKKKDVQKEYEYK